MTQNLVSNEEPTFALAIYLVVVLYYDVQCVHGHHMVYCYMVMIILSRPDLLLLDGEPLSL